jgi:hypothetical protein
MTATLEKAFQSLRSLPQDMQEELGESLLSYATRWRELQSAITTGSAELARGEGIEVSDIGEFVGQIERKHGRS